MQPRPEGTGTILTYATRACETKLCYFYEGACASVVALKRAGGFMSRSFIVVWSLWFGATSF
jgi:hypothetical protein